MNSVLNRMTGRSVPQVSRRDFLKALSAGSLVLMGRYSDAAEQQAGLEDPDRTPPETFAPDYFVAIEPDGTVVCLVHRSEMGTGIRTGLPRVVADELDADWDRVKILQAIGDKRLGDQNTDGSNSIRLFFDRMRQAGATARTMLEQAAARKWNVDVGQCYAENHRIHLRGTDKSFGYGELVASAKTLDIPKAESLKFKPRDKWNYIGKDTPIVDLQDIVTGKAVYGIDARMKNQLFAVIARPPVVGGKVKSFDDSAARKMPGVAHVVELPRFQGAPVFQQLGGVAVCATSTAVAITARDALKIEWEHGDNASYDTEQFQQTLLDTVRKPGESVRSNGDASQLLTDAPHVLRADYFVPHLAHASMETTCAVADVKTDAAGNVTSCRVLAATQNPQAVQQAVGPALAIDPGEVVCEVTLLGSGFGRKSKPDYCVEAALLSQKFGRPIQVTWTREDDLQHDYYHTIAAIHCEAAVDDSGKPQAWLQRAAYPTIASTFDASKSAPATFEAEMGLTDLPFDVANVRVEVCPAPSHTRIGWFRSVCHIPQNFAVSSFADELAHNAGSDPLEYLLQLLGPDRHLDLKACSLSNRNADPEKYPYDIGRLKNVLKRAADKADWSRRKDLPKGHGLGIAGSRSFLGYCAYVVEVTVSQDGQLTIPKVWGTLDAGTIVSPDRVHAQLEGAVIMATTSARYGKISFKNGQAEQSNFDDYTVVTMSDCPGQIFTDLVDSTAAPSGVGETGIPPFAPALCNAIFNATGKRIRQLPLADHDLSWS
ncbi:MAG: molybdopterin cofactor-binding domain-containing protein [Planctomycetaceae bacterium]